MSPRRAVRVLLVDPDDRLLLLDWSGRWWITPGGGIEPGETVAAAAVRELREEVGLALPEDEVGAAVWRQSITLTSGCQQDQTFHLVRCSAFEPDLSGLEPHEAEITGWRWWTVAELAAHQGPARIGPSQLPRLLPALLAEPWDAGPLDLSSEPG